MTRRTLCLFLALLAALSLCVNAYADEALPALTVEPPVESAAEATAEPAPEPTVEPAAESTPDSALESSAESTPEPSVEPSDEPAPESAIEPVLEDDGVAVASAGQSGYRQTLAKELFDKINALRATPGVWYWRQNPPNGASESFAETFKEKPRLSPLTYSGNLENTAKDMATALAKGYATPPTDDTAWVIGPITAQAAFDALAMEDGTYDGQKYRRAMLGGFAAVGVACYVRNGTYYWALQFGGTGSATAPGPDTVDGVVASGNGWKLEDTGVLTITGNAAMADYNDEYPAPWSVYASDITAVNIGNGVTRIGANAFAACWSLTRVSIPGTVTSIGENAFNWCCRLQTIDLSAATGLESIGDNAFASCSELTAITIPEGVISLGHTAFFGCEKLQAVTLPASLIIIGNCAFEMCGNAQPGGTIYTVPANAYARSYLADAGVSAGQIKNSGGDCGHNNWDAGRVTVLATCVDPGTREYACRTPGCGRRKYELVPPLGHLWDGGVVTEVFAGNKLEIRTYTCTRPGCGTKKDESVYPGQTGWAKEGGRWYWYENGVRAVSRFVDGGQFYVGPDGVMLTGWQKISGSWYYFRGGNSGRMLTGWQKIGSGWYYLDPATGRMATGLTNVGGSWYCLAPGDSGRMLTGWQKIGGSWYYFKGGSSGRMLTGWQKIGSGWYYLDPASGKMATGFTNVGGNWYYLTPGDSGRMLTGWQKIGGSWYYFKGGSSGRMLTGWQKISGGWYYLDPATGKMATGLIDLGGVRYYLRPGDSGRMLTGWISLGGGNWYYAYGSGALARNSWIRYKGGWYYLKDDCLMARNETINGYRFNDAGVWVG